MKRKISFLLGKIKIIILRICGIKVPFANKVNYSTSFESPFAVEGTHNTFINCYFNRYSYVGYNNYFINTKIGMFTSIGNNVRVSMGNHLIKNYVSTSPVFYLKSHAFKKDFKVDDKYNPIKFVDSNCKYVCEIGNDVWIGDNVIILQGVKIGNGACIGAGSVVTKNVEPYSVMAGVPAKLIRYRFEKEQIEKLQLINWTSWPIGRIKENLSLFDDVNEFIGKNYDK